MSYIDSIRAATDEGAAKVIAAINELPASIRDAVIKKLQAGDATLPPISAATDPVLRPILTPMQAAAAKPQNPRAIANLKARLARHGFAMRGNEHIDQLALDAALKGVDTIERLAVKATLAHHHLIP